MKIGSLEDQKSPKNAKMGILGHMGDTYAVVGRPNNLVIACANIIRKIRMTDAV
jgi:hypothetical protein